MKHQYFGDINDYRKYGILRALAAGGLNTTICWMLTENDKRTDGRNINYLRQPEKMRLFDPELFDALNYAVLEKRRRNIEWIRKLRLIPHARYHNQMLDDDLSAQQQYFNKLTTIARGTDLIFFDPDNGIEVKSVPKGKIGSHQYLHWDEIKRFWDLGYSILIYQHFPRVNRMEYVRKLSHALHTHTGAAEVIAFKTSTVAFFLLPQLRYRKDILSAVESIRSGWKGMIEVYQM